MSIWPSPGQWLFSAKVFIASMLALYIALALGLPRPYWAMATVYLVSNPLTGATRSKGAYRVAGTLLGAAAAVALVPPLVNAPLMLMGAISLWTGAFLYLSLMQRAPRSYIFLLAAYTLPIVALPAVTQPTQVFDVALARIEEIVLGIVCASLVSSLVFPQKVAPALRGRAEAWLADAAQWVADMLSPQGAQLAEQHQSRHHLAADILALDHLIAQLAYDTESAATLERARALHERMTMLLPVLSSLAEVTRALRHHPEGMPTSLARRMAALTQWIAAGADADPHRPAAAHTAWQEYDRAPGWHAGLVATAASHLDTLGDLWEDCQALRRGIGDARAASAMPAMRYGGALSARAYYHDHGMLLFYACSAALAVFCAGLFWILSGWVDGAGAVGLAALTSSFFATTEEPHKLAWRFVKWSGVCLLISWFYQFLVLPYAHDFGSLAAMLAIPYLGIGTLMPRPGFNLFAVLLSVNSASFANVQSVYDANFADIFNSSLASFAAMLFAPVWVLVTRPFGSHVMLRRLIRASWKDIALGADRREAAAHPTLGGRMLDRFSRLVPMLAANRDKASSDGFAELQAGFSALALQRDVGALQPGARRAVSRLLLAVARHYRSRVAAGHALPAPPALARRIDDAIAAIASPADAMSQEAIAALVSLRLSLFAPAGKGADAAPLLIREVRHAGQ
ncbi:FUSC family protein [Cupriavidus sp. 2TAF22]|uniref:FUSC family protein n=1 Tax=unclassified Cupriavidus TaxID=2640874 RepID=UPI003F910DCC